MVDVVKSISNTITKTKGQVLIVVPQLQHIQKLQESIPDAVIWESSMSTKEKRETWTTVRNGAQIIIGTRSSIFLPLFNLSDVCIIDEEWQDHKSWDQAPRYRVHDIAQRMHGITLTYYSRTPSFATMHGITKSNMKEIGTRTPTNINIIDMTKERGAGNFDVVSSTDRVTEEHMIENHVFYIHICMGRL